MSNFYSTTRLKTGIGLFLGLFLFLPTVLRPADLPPIKVKPVFVGKVTESAAMGFVNGTNFLFDAKGTGYFSASTQGSNNTPSVAIFRATRYPDKPRFEKIVIKDADSSVEFGLPHISQTIALGYPGSLLHVVWSGGLLISDLTKTTGHQIRYKNISLNGQLNIRESTMPFMVKGYLDRYASTRNVKHLWQEFPSIVATGDGALHVAWEARDNSRSKIDGQPIPAIAYATRSSTGTWSVNGAIDIPPYLSLKGPAQYQLRPSLVVGKDNTIFVFCYGQVEGKDYKDNIEYGEIKDSQFSGWTLLAPTNRDQKNIKAVADHRGNIHAVWREEVPDQGSLIKYSVRNFDGRWSTPLDIGNPDQFNSTPSIAVTDTSVFVAWIGWDPGFVNSNSLQDNGFPQDIDTVEGSAYIVQKLLTAGTFSSQNLITGGTASYPNLAINPLAPAFPSAVWTEGQQCLPTDCISLFYGNLHQ